MQACLENTALPLSESTSLQLVDTVPAWTIRVARPASPNRNELAKQLLGVPKTTLRHVFGKVLGTRLWQQNRTAAMPHPSIAKAVPVAAISTPAIVSDREISIGMLHYLCAEAAATLCEHKRFAKSIALTVQYSDGESEAVQQALPQTANDAASLEIAARLALPRMRSHIFVSLKLDVTATAVACAAPSADLTATRPPLSRVA